MDNFEKHISTQLQNDELSFSPDTAIHNRLMYHMQLKSSQSTVRKNNILPTLSFHFATKLLAWKLGIAAILLFSFMGYKQFNQSTTIFHLSDTAQVVNTIDTTNFLVKDSVLIY